MVVATVVVGGPNREVTGSSRCFVVDFELALHGGFLEQVVRRFVNPVGQRGEQRVRVKGRMVFVGNLQIT